MSASDRESAEGVWSVPLPDGAEPPFEVFVNGVQQSAGADYSVQGRWLRFARPLTPRPSLSGWQKFVLSLGIGVYRDLRADVVDVQYTRDGRVTLATGLTALPPQEPLDRG